jgi:hypothetical protein
MRIHPLIALAVVAGGVVLVAALWDERNPTGELRARQRPPLTTFEQEMYRRLLEAFPGMFVLAQVAITALISTPRKDRHRYHHKVIDFVLLDRAFQVQAAIELDDETQASRHTVGEPVKELLELAGYRVLEFNRVPEVAELQRLLAPAPTAGGAGAEAAKPAPGAPARTPVARRPGPAPDFPVTRVE